MRVAATTDNYRPGPTIGFGVSELVYGTHYLTSDEEGWHNGTYGYHFISRCGFVRCERVEGASGCPQGRYRSAVGVPRSTTIAD